jgi:hypothetical protein
METPRCLNCGTPLQGPFCHACGQPTKGMVRHLASVLGDILDTVFEYDSRIWRTLVLLYFRPGRITQDYLVGRRVRYVLPFRLLFVLTVAAFLLLQLALSPIIVPAANLSRAGAIDSASTVAEVESARDAALAGLAERRRALDPAADTAALTALDAAERAVAGTARQRIDWLNEAEVARAEGRDPPAYRSPGIIFGADAWDPATNPIEVGWLPAGANATINRWIARAERNIRRAGEEPERLVSAFLGLLPAVLFVLMPVFALLLKIFYLLQRRLYMEHLVVALHSHSFLALALIIGVSLATLGELVSWLEWPSRALYLLSMMWVPLYLLLMQARVYRQGWFATSIKFLLIGVIYTVTVSVALVMAVLVTLVTA